MSGIREVAILTIQVNEKEAAMRGSQIARQWKIIRLMETRKQGLSGADLARELDVPLRTVYRDLDVIHEAGFPLYSDKYGKTSVWKMLDTFKNDFSLPVTAAELMALSLSRDILGIFEGTIFCNGIETLFQKVRSSQLPANRTQLEKFSGTLIHQVVPNAAVVSKIRDIVKRMSEANGTFKPVKMDRSGLNHDGGYFNEKNPKTSVPI
jgi:predicted DNA-binding transcriptional regulator YafY